MSSAAKPPKRTIPLGQWYFLATALLFIPVMIALLLASRYVGQALREQAVQYNDNILALYMERLETNALGVERFLIAYPTSNYDVSTLALSANERDRYLASESILRDLARNAMVFENCDGIFVYSQSSVQDVFLCKTATGVKGSEITELRRVVETMPAAEIPPDWFLHEQGGERYLVRFVRNGSTVCGAWINLRSMMLPLDRVELSQDGFALITDGQGQPLTGTVPDASALPSATSGQRIRMGDALYLHIAMPSKTMPISLHVLIPDRAFSARSNAISGVIVLIFIVALCIASIVASFFGRSLSRPVGRLIVAMGLAETGDLTVQAETGSRFREFGALTEHFNRMILKIGRLERDVYRRKISEQRTQMEYLQLQIKPHFFLNALNVIYSFALVKRVDLVEKMVIFLTRHFRYIFQSAVSFVSLRDERLHIQNYMEIQALRYPGNFQYTEEIDEAALDVLMPPLILQTFIENSIKYALDIEEVRAITLRAEAVQRGGMPYLRLLVSDNGKGYPADYLEQFAAGAAERGKATQIGIWNARQRLALLYGAAAWIVLENGPEGGAMSVIYLPWTPPKAADEEAI